MIKVEYPYDQVFDQPEPGLRQQTLITYKTVAGVFKKITVTRNYYGDCDYQDSVTTEVLS